MMDLIELLSNEHCQIAQLCERILFHLKDEWISECEELCRILRKPHFIALISVIDRLISHFLLRNRKIKDDSGSEFELKTKPNYCDDDGHDRRKLAPIRPKKRKYFCQKIISVFKSDEPLGVTVCFDKSTGDIILARILVGGPAYRSGLINVGDKILEVNGIRLRGRSHFDVISILQKECLKTIITFKIVIKQRCTPNEGVRSCIVRAHFDYNPNEDPMIPCPKIGLAFERGAILQILNKDDADWWQACKEIESSTNKSRMQIFQIAGLVPSQTLQERRIVMYRDFKSRIDRDRYVHILGGLVPLPFRKRKWCAPKIRKIMYDLGDCDRYDREEICTYEKVAQFIPRPGLHRAIVLIGPSDFDCSMLISWLCNRSPERYRQPLYHTSRFKRFQENDSIDFYFVEEDWIEQELREGNFLCCYKHRGNYYGIHRDTVKQIINETGSICCFQIDARFIRLVSTADFKPFIIFVRPPYDVDELIRIHRKKSHIYSFGSHQKSLNRLRYEMQLLIYESHRLETLYGHRFDATIVNEDIQKSFQKFIEIVLDVEKKPSWIPINWIKQHQSC